MIKHASLQKTSSSTAGKKIEEDDLPVLQALKKQLRANDEDIPVLQAGKKNKLRANDKRIPTLETLKKEPLPANKNGTPAAHTKNIRVNQSLKTEKKKPVTKSSKKQLHAKDDHIPVLQALKKQLQVSDEQIPVLHVRRDKLPIDSESRPQYPAANTRRDELSGWISQSETESESLLKNRSNSAPKVSANTTKENPAFATMAILAIGIIAASVFAFSRMGENNPSDENLTTPSIASKSEFGNTLVNPKETLAKPYGMLTDSKRVSSESNTSPWEPGSAYVEIDATLPEVNNGLTETNSTLAQMDTGSVEPDNAIADTRVTPNESDSKPLDTDSTLTEQNDALTEQNNLPAEPDNALDDAMADSGGTLTEPDNALDNAMADSGGTLTEPDNTVDDAMADPGDIPTEPANTPDDAMADPGDTPTEPANTLDDAMADPGNTLTESDNTLVEADSTLTAPDNALAEADNTSAAADNMPELKSKTLREPDESLELSSPLGTVRNEIDILITELSEANKILSNDSNDQQALKTLSTIGSKFAMLAESPVVKSNNNLSNQVADALVRSVGVSADTHDLIENLIKAESSTNARYLESLLLSESIHDDEQQQQTLVFGLASASAETRQVLQDYPEYVSLLDKFKDSIRLTIQAGKFQLAARMTEIALLLHNEDAELLALSDHLSKAR